MRLTLNRPRPDLRPRHRSTTQEQVEQARDRAWQAASLPRFTL